MLNTNPIGGDHCESVNMVNFYTSVLEISMAFHLTRITKSILKIHEVIVNKIWCFKVSFKYIKATQLIDLYFSYTFIQRV